MISCKCKCYIHSVCYKCTFCKICVENIESISFWVNFKVDKTKQVNKALNLEPHDILLCFQNPYLSDKQIYIINLLIILAKFYIHKSKLIQNHHILNFVKKNMICILYKIYFETLSKMRSPK